MPRRVAAGEATHDRATASGGQASYPEVSVVDPDEAVVSILGIAVAWSSPAPRRNGTGTAATPFGVSPPLPFVNSLLVSSIVVAWRGGGVLPPGRRS
jgi:hypothetical protein